MSSCFSGGRAYKLNPIDLEMIKSPSSTTSWISNSSSPSSTLSESSNCPLPLISTRKPRTPRKRPNQTYNEAAAILSTAYPKIFPTNKQPCKFTKSLLENKNKNNNNDNNSSNPFIPFDPSDLLVPFQAIDDSSGFLLHNQRSSFEPKGRNYLFEKLSCQSPSEINSELVCGDDQLGELDFDAESIILDEEIGEGIDCIMGDLGMENETSIEDISTYNNNNDDNNNNNAMQVSNNFCYGYPVGLGFEFGQFGMKMERMAMRNNGDEGDWWRFPSVNVHDLTPRPAKNKKKKKMVELKNLEMKKEDLGVKGVCMSEEIVVPQKNEGLLLKLNFDGVLDAWSDKASPFSGDCTGPELAGNDVQARLAQIDLFSDNGGIREASVLRYKEKRRNRLFSKKIRYQVRKLNADRRPRMKGRFVRKSSSSDD
ncbi:hypothetical protein CASFOL_012099 [Castilleja foliolosa]|uniref:CCT domain-containing protein n=1 Tax=Castilleja foliolosa TaxID=1961234 RepID=A0ABD3DRC0_9LAMI